MNDHAFNMATASPQGRILLFSVSYVLQRYVFSRLGLAIMIALSLTLWVANRFEHKTFGAAANPEAELMVLSWAMLVLLSLALSVVIGAIIDGKRGALWGLLGPFGWIIAAIGRLENRTAPKPTSRAEQDSESHDQSENAHQNNSYDVKKWLILKEVDPEIREASDRVSALDPKLDAVLADKYLRLSQKEYLEPLVARLISDATKERKSLDPSSHVVEPGIYETSGPFRFRVLPDYSITVFSDPSGSMPRYERFNGVGEFFNAYQSRGARLEVMTKLD